MQVMVVDDDAVSRLALVDLMSRAGFNDILEFEDGKAALDYLQIGPMPVLCCCDVRMPRMSGIELLEHVRADKRMESLPFVLITSGSERDVVQRAIVLGVSGYIVKPFNADNALEKLVEIIAKEWKEIAEKPDTSAKRLSIGLDKLLTYYDAFIKQIEHAKKTVSDAPENKRPKEAQEQIAALCTGCLTLGLWHSAKQLEALKGASMSMQEFSNYLDSVIQAVIYQRSLLK